MYIYLYICKVALVYGYCCILSEDTKSLIYFIKILENCFHLLHHISNRNLFSNKSEEDIRLTFTVWVTLAVHIHVWSSGQTKRRESRNVIFNSLKEFPTRLPLASDGDRA